MNNNTKAFTKPSNPSIPVYVIFNGTLRLASSTHPVLAASSVIGSHSDTLVFQHRPRCQENGKQWNRPETPAEGASLCTTEDLSLGCMVDKSPQKSELQQGFRNGRERKVEYIGRRNSPSTCLLKQRSALQQALGMSAFR